MTHPEVIDVSTTWGTHQSLVALGIGTAVALTMLVWLTIDLVRARRRWKEGERLRRDAVLAEALPTGVTAVVGEVDPHRTGAVELVGGRAHGELTFSPFLVYVDGAALRVEPHPEARGGATKQRLSLEPGAEVDLVGEITPARGDAPATLKPPAAARFEVSLEPLPKRHRSRTRVDLFFAIVVTVLFVPFLLSFWSPLRRAVDGEKGEATVESVKRVERESGMHTFHDCHVVATRPDGVESRFIVGGNFCEDPDLAGNLTVGDRVPMIYVRGTANEQLGYELLVELAFVVMLLPLLVVASLLYLFFLRILTQDPTHIETVP